MRLRSPVLLIAGLLLGSPILVPKCSKPSITDVGTITPDSATIAIGESYTITCPTNYFMTGEGEMTCSEDGDSAVLSDTPTCTEGLFTCDTFGLKSVHEKFLSAQWDGSVQWNRDAYLSWETISFEPSESDPNKGYFRSTHGKYLSAQNDLKTLQWNMDKKGAWMEFTIEQVGNKVALKTKWGRYVSAQSDGSVDADRTWKRSWELFTVHPATCLRSNSLLNM